MATKLQIAERIAYSFNEPLNVMLKENIKFSLDNWRAMLIRQDVQQNGLSDGFLQRVSAPLIQVDYIDDCKVDLGCKILRTKDKVPSPVRLKTDVLFKFVGLVTGQKSFDYVEFEELFFTTFNKFTSKDIKYSYINGYIYIFNNVKLKYVGIQSIFEYPQQINNFCEGGICFDENTSEYPLPIDMIPRIFDGIKKGEFVIQNPVNETVPVQNPDITT